MKRLMTWMALFAIVFSGISLTLAKSVVAQEEEEACECGTSEDGECLPCPEPETEE